VSKRSSHGWLRLQLLNRHNLIFLSRGVVSAVSGSLGLLPIVFHEPDQTKHLNLILMFVDSWLTSA